MERMEIELVNPLTNESIQEHYEELAEKLEILKRTFKTTYEVYQINLSEVNRLDREEQYSPFITLGAWPLKLPLFLKKEDIVTLMIESAFNTLLDFLG